MMKESARIFLIPITKLVTFLGMVPKSSLLSTSNIGIQVEALTHAFKTHKKSEQNRSRQNNLKFNFNIGFQ